MMDQLPGGRRWYDRVRASTPSLLWIAAITAFVSVSLPTIFRGVSRGTQHFVGPFHSSDSFLNYSTGVRNGSERLVTLFDALPPKKEILIIVRDDNKQSSFLGMVVAYLAWPHPVQIVDLKQMAEPLERAQRNSIAAVAFCHVKGPPWWPPGKKFGDSLEIVSIQETP